MCVIKYAPLFVVSVALLLSADKTPNTNKEEVRDIKSLFVMYYRPSDRLMAYDLFKTF